MARYNCLFGPPDREAPDYFMPHPDVNTVFSLATTALLACAALLLDRLLGEPQRWHPLAGFGLLANRVEALLRRGEPGHAIGNRLRGLVVWLLLIAPLGALAAWAAQQRGGPLLDLLLLYFALGARSLEEHALAVARPLAAGDLDAARQRVGWMVSRHTEALDETGVASATVESVLENGNDAIFGALFWFCIAGGAGALVFRLANTLDAMWGYRDARRMYFGWAAARLDDALNLIPARLTALSYALLGRCRSALTCWRTQAPQWSSPNAGPVMAAGAGALQLRLGGAAIYHGHIEQRPDLGCGHAPVGQDIVRAVALVRATTALWLGVLLSLALIRIGYGVLHA